MPYDIDRRVAQWFDCALRDARPAVRCAAVELLERVECPGRAGWLSEAQMDPDLRVVATAVLVEIATAGDAGEFELFESDFADGGLSTDLAWEWEYRVVMCLPGALPGVPIYAWTRTEDDTAAKSIALMRAFPSDPPSDAVAVILGKCLVTAYTRSPRGAAESATWKRRGRPRYRESP